MNLSEETFYAHLTNPDSLDYIVREGFTLEVVLDVIPHEVGRRLTTWAIGEYFNSGRTVAPSKEAIMATWGDKLAPLDISINDEYESDSIQWAVEQLRCEYADWQSGEFAKSMVKAVRDADGPDRAGVVLEYSQLLHMLSQSLIPRRNEKIGEEGIAESIKRYEDRQSTGHIMSGLTFGLKELDDHTLGVHPGELAVLASTSGGGKSWSAIIVMLAEIERGRKPILFTLENDVEVTFDRMACVKCRVNYEKWQRGECEIGDIQRVKAYLEKLESIPPEKQPIIIQPDLTESTASAMVRRAVIENCDSIIVDQLSHVAPVAGSKARQRNEVVAEIIRDFDRLIKTPGSEIPLLLLHQINRKGREEARKVGRYLMDHLGEATQIENAATLVLAIYQSDDHQAAEMAELQMLKARRVVPKDFEMKWRPAVGDVVIRREVVRE